MEQISKLKTAEELWGEIMEIDQQIIKVDEKTHTGRQEFQRLSLKKDKLLTELAQVRGEPVDKWRKNL